ncbi:unnamed protein product [Durusdinium trenchii]|uniref:Uncharacterized protein n=1 Tax=Durusdinium trenchii TaxID=1381693 RepID=A0ABP0NLI5_9DINO
MNMSKTEVLVQRLQPTVQVSTDPGIIQEAVRAVSEVRAETALVVSQAVGTVAGTQMEAAQAVSVSVAVCRTDLLPKVSGSFAMNSYLMCVQNGALTKENA